MPNDAPAASQTISTFQDMVSQHGPINDWTTDTFKTGLILFTINPLLAKERDGYNWEVFKSWFIANLRQLRMKAHVFGLKTEVLDSLISIRYPPPSATDTWKLFDGLSNLQRQLIDIDLANELKSKQNQTEKNGLIPPDKLYYNGNTTELEPLPWKLLNFFWCSSGPIEEPKLLGEIWGANSDVSISAIKSAACKVNAALTKVECPFQIRRKTGFLTFDRGD